MPFLIEAGFTTGATLDPDYLILDDPVAGLLDDGQLLAPDDLTTDLSTDRLGAQRTMQFVIDRGATQQAGALVDYTAATMSLTLRDDQGDLDPYTIGTPIPGSLIRFSFVWGGDVYPLFTGFIDSWLPEHRYPDQAVVQVTATDALGQLAGYKRGEVAAVGAGEDTGARLNRILDSIGWPAGERNIAAGASTLMATTLAGDPLTEIQQSVRSEVGEFYADAPGRPTFRSRRGLYLDDRSVTVQATFGSDPTAGELPFVGTLGLSYDKSEMVNVVRAARAVDDAIVYEVGDDVSRNRYLDKAQEQTDLLLTDDAEVLGWAQYVLARDSQPKLRFTDVTIDVRTDEALMYPQALNRWLGDRIAVVRRPPGLASGGFYPSATTYPGPAVFPGRGGPDTHEVHIRGLRHAFTAPNQWTTTWEVEPADLLNLFILDDPIHGLLDADNVLIW